MSHDSCALNSDGSLKDASDIVFFNDPDDHAPLPQVPPKNVPPKNAFTALLQSGRTPALTTAGSRRSTRTSKPSARVRDADNAHASSSTRKRVLSSATDPPAPKKAAAMRFFSPLDTDEEDEDEGNNPSPPPTQEGSFYEEYVPLPDDNDNEAKSGNGDDASQTTVRFLLYIHCFLTDTHV